ncbi:hypothetical protein [Bdellovibrio bacteriovorus]|uniref:hypothetical protein n=1 Tax=Bdellovibrio bacteriovorus TaxID=959 RepID=UPI0035A72280
MKKSALLFTTELPRPADLGEELLLIHDEILPRKSKAFKKMDGTVSTALSGEGRGIS